MERAGLSRIQDGLGALGRVSDQLDAEIVATARDVVGDDNQLMVDAGGSDAHWQGRYTWALRCAQMLADYGVDCSKSRYARTIWKSSSTCGAIRLFRSQAAKP